MTSTPFPCDSIILTSEGKVLENIEMAEYETNAVMGAIDHYPILLFGNLSTHTTMRRPKRNVGVL